MPRTGLTAAEIKDKAISVTMARMRAEGFDKVRLTEIARELGVSHAALYAHFADKSALFDAVSERWLVEIDETLDTVCKKPGKTPIQRMLAWMLALHRAKVQKVLQDPEVYKAFDVLANAKKPYVQRHIATMHTQLVGLLQEAIEARRLRDADAEKMAEIFWEAMMAFHHPKLVAQHVNEKREPLLKRVFESVVKGLELEA